MSCASVADATGITETSYRGLTVLRRFAGVCGIASQVIALVILLVAVYQFPWFSWTEQDLSILGVEGPAATLFNSGLIITGALSLIFALGLAKSLLSGRFPGRLGVVSLFLGSAALSATGIFPETNVISHNFASIAFLIFISIAILFIGIRALAVWSKIWGVLSITAAILIVAFQQAPWPWSGAAIPQLLSCWLWSWWTTAFAIRLLVKPGHE